MVLNRRQQKHKERAAKGLSRGKLKYSLRGAPKEQVQAAISEHEKARRVAASLK